MWTLFKFAGLLTPLAPIPLIDSLYTLRTIDSRTAGIVKETDQRECVLQSSTLDRPLNLD